MPKIEVIPSQDKTEVTLNVDGVEVKANALQLDLIIQGLVAARANLLPAFPKEPPFGEQVAVVHDPRYWTNFVPDSGAALLMLQHPGMGWLSFVFPPVERDRLIGYLAEQAKQETTPAAGPANPSVH